METKKKVFVVTEEYVNELCGFNDFSPSDNVIRIVGVFTNKEDAVAKLRSMAESYKKEERTLWDEENPQFEDFNDSDNLFSCWKDGSYSQEHYTIMLHESKLFERKQN